MLALFVRDRYYPKLDCLRLLKMLILHEFGETGKAGDITPTDGITAKEKHRMEKETVIALFKDFPNGESYIALWEEFEEGKTNEARLAKAIDKLEMCMQAKIYSLQHNKDLQEFFDRAREQMQFSEVLALFEEVEKI